MRVALVVLQQMHGFCIVKNEESEEDVCRLFQLKIAEPKMFLEERAIGLQVSQAVVTTVA